MDPTLLWSYLSCHLRHFYPGLDTNLTRFRGSSSSNLSLSISRRARSIRTASRRDCSRSCRSFLILHGIEYKDLIGPRNSIFFCQFCVHFCLHFCRHEVLLCFGIYSNWINDFNYNADPSPTPKYCELNILVFINVAIPFYHDQLIALIILKYPFHLSHATYLLYNLHFMLIPTQDHLIRPIMYYATQPFSVNKYATSKMTSADYFGLALHLLPLVPPFNTPYLGLSRDGVQPQFLLTKLQGPKGEQVFPVLFPLPNNYYCFS
jgi:hypothetical protein